MLLPWKPLTKFLSKALNIFIYKLLFITCKWRETAVRHCKNKELPNPPYLKPELLDLDFNMLTRGVPPLPDVELFQIIPESFQLLCCQVHHWLLRPLTKTSRFAMN